MPTRVTFDNNFLDRFDEATPSAREAVLRCVESGQLEVFVNYEVLREVVGLASTTSSPKLIRFSKHILLLARGHFLNLIQPMLESEVQGEVALEMAPELRDQLVAFLTQAANGHIPSRAEALGLQAVREKRLAFAELSQYAPLIERIPRHFSRQQRKEIRRRLNAQLKTVAFADVSRKYWEKYGQKLLARYFRDWGLPLPETLAERVFRAPDQYRRVRTWFAILALPAYRYGVKGDGRDPNVHFDLRQMLYMVDMDVYVTNEKRLPSWHADVFGSGTRVLTAEQLFAEKWC